METLQPKLRFPEFSGDWDKKNLVEIGISVIDGDRGSNYPNGNDFSSDGYCLFLNAKNVTKNGFSFIEKSFISKEKDERLRKGKLQKFDIILTTRGSVGHISFFDSSVPYENLRINSGMVIIRTNPEIVHSNYLYKYLKSNQIQNEISKIAFGSAQPQLTVFEILKFKVCFPELDEQTKIANFFSAIDKKINQLTQKKKLLEQYKKGVMQKIFNQEIRFKDDNGNDFADWDEQTLGNIGTFQTSSVDKLYNEDEKEVYLVNYMNVYNHENINKSSIKNLNIVTAKDSQIISNSLKKGDILFTPSSETPDDIGHSVVIFEDIENTLYSYHLLRFRPKINIDILFSHYFCNTTSVLNQLTKYATGSTRFTISVGNFSKVEVKLPCIEEQTKIANFLSTIDENINQVSKQLEQTTQYKKGLLQQMFV